MKVILICGKAGSGKNQLAEYISNYLDVDSKGAVFYRTLIRGNAQSVKDLAVRYHNWNGLKDKQGRQLLIDITNKGYEKDPFHWEQETFTEAIMYREFINRNCEYLIIPDWRYEQTLQYFSKVADEVTTIRVKRPNLEAGSHKYHTSENALDLFKVDIEVNNTSNLTHLKSIAKRIVGGM